MSNEINIERGDKFVVMDARHRGNHYTCTGIGTYRGDEYFYAGDTQGRVWKFKQKMGEKYRVYGPDNFQRYFGIIPAEAIIND